jgi:glycosidase
MRYARSRSLLLTLSLFACAALLLAACDDSEGQQSERLDLGPIPDFWDPGDVPVGTSGGSGSGSGSSGATDQDATPDVEEDTTPPPPCDEVTFTFTSATALSVSVTGTFTDWAFTDADGALPLTKDPVSGDWTLTTTIADHGQHHYQFIIDGREWVADPSNVNQITDQLGGFRSVIDVCDSLPAPPCGTVILRYEDTSLQSVWVSGEFTTWATTPAEGAVEMQDVNGVWLARVELEPGPTLYKFILNGGAQWVYDPNNPDRVDDGFGSFNSVLTVDCGGPSGSCGDTAAFDWRDAVMYFVMVDRFYDSNGQATPVSGVTGDSGNGASGQYEGGDLPGVTAKMDYLADLGVTTIWLSAPYENRNSGGAAIDPNADPRIYSAYHGYWPSPANVNYSAAPTSPAPSVESRIGSAADLKAMIAAAHGATSANGHGIKVLFDYVMNHVDIDSGLYQAHQSDGWFAKVDNRIVLCAGDSVCGGSCWDHPEWTTKCAFTNYLPPFDFNNAAARAWSVNDAIWWAKEFGIDGYRLDAIKHVPLVWLTDLRLRLNQEFPDPTGGRFYLVGETYTWGDFNILKFFVDPQTKLDGQFDFPWRKEVCRAVLRQESGLSDLRSFMDVNDQRYGAGALMSTWLGNHDIPRVIHNATGQFGCEQGSYADIGWQGRDAFPQPTEAEPYEKLRVAFAILLTSPGLPLIYYGDEVGLAGGGDPDNRREMIWNDSQLNDHQKALRASVRALARARGENPSLSRGRRTTLSVDADTWVYRMGGCGASAPDVIVAINRSASPRSLNVPAGAYTDLITNAPSSGGAVSVAPRSFTLLRAE